MKFTDIAMELSREAWQASFRIPLFYSYKRER